MYLGHLGLALGVKGARPVAPLWILFLATLAPDLTAPALAAAGLSSDLYSHSVPAMLVYGAVAFGAYLLAFKNRTTAVWVGGLACSHVVVDYITSRIMTFPGLPPWGLHLYAHPWADAGLEAAVIALGWALYRRSVPPGRRNSLAAWSIPALLISLEVAVAAAHLIG